VRWVGSLLLAGAVALVFGQTALFDYVNFDDPGYVSENPHVLAGLTADGIAWAFTTFQEGHWHPLTWVSHMAAVSAFGPEPGAHHAVNVALHAANAIALFWILALATGRNGAALAVAMLFAVHPLRAESVAWVTERKDVLSTLFWMLATLAWLRFVATRAAVPWCAALVCFAAGLLTKPMVVTLPFAWLLLDHWPLGRWPSTRTSRLIIEKAPFFVLCAASAAVAWYGQHAAGAMNTLDQTSLAQRLANVPVTYLATIGQWLWPANLAVFYPATDVRPGLGVAATLALAMFTWRLWKAEQGPRPMMVGWLWYLGTYVPVVGLVQIGGQSMADRFSYVPSIGLAIMAVWGVAALQPRLQERFGERAARLGIEIASVVGIYVLAVVGQQQVGVWKDSQTLWRHTLEVVPDNFMAHNNLAVVLSAAGELDEAEFHAREAARLNPTYPPARINYGNALARRGDYDGALENFSAALSRQSDSVTANYNTGLALAYLGRTADAERYYRRTLELDPGYAMAHYSLGALLTRGGHREEGVRHLRRALELRPGWEDPLRFLQSMGEGSAS
jgi:tetratricopeptide (TPR) repeat protein